MSRHMVFLWSVLGRGWETSFMAEKSVAIAADHAGFALKTVLRQELDSLGWRVNDLGTHNTDRTDYPDFGYAVADEIAAGRATFGVLVCGTGIGISIAANRNPAVRAAVCHDAPAARLSRQHNDANVLALGSRIVGEEVAKDCLRVFLDTAFEGGRHAARVAKLAAADAAAPPVPLRRVQS